MAEVQPGGANCDLRSDLKQPSSFATKCFIHGSHWCVLMQMTCHLMVAAITHAIFSPHGNCNKKENTKGCCFNWMDTVFACTYHFLLFISNNVLKKKPLKSNRPPVPRRVDFIPGDNLQVHGGVKPCFVLNPGVRCNAVFVSFWTCPALIGRHLLSLHLWAIHQLIFKPLRIVKLVRVKFLDGVPQGPAYGTVEILILWNPLDVLDSAWLLLLSVQDSEKDFLKLFHQLVSHGDLERRWHVLFGTNIAKVSHDVILERGWPDEMGDDEAQCRTEHVTKRRAGLGPHKDLLVATHGFPLGLHSPWAQD